jgi:hypothetical protein
MNEQEAQRNDTMYDEHFPPREGMEKTIMDALGDKEIPASVFIKSLEKKGHNPSDVRDGILPLLDRGFLELTRDYKLKGHSEPICPAPCDLL